MFRRIVSSSFHYRAVLFAGLIILIALGSFRQASKTNFASGSRVSLGLKSPNHLGHGRSLLQPPNRATGSQLVIDPVLVYSTLLGGTSSTPLVVTLQRATAMTVDASGNTYLAGATSASDFPVTPGVVQATNSSNDHIGFLVKLDPQGHLIFATYLSGMNSAAAVAIDSSTGNIVVAGGDDDYFKSTPLPIPSGTTPFNSSPRTISIIRLNSTATAVLNATYLGGTLPTLTCSTGVVCGSDEVAGLALDSSGNVYVDGNTKSTDFPTLNPIQGTLNGSQIGMFVTKLKPDLSALVYSTYLGNDSFILSLGSSGVAVDASGDAYVTGVATSGFPTTSGALQPTCTSACGFVAKLNPAGSALSSSTYFGGNRNNAETPFFVSSIAVDSSQNVFLAGGLWDIGFPTVNPVATCATGTTDNNGNGFVSEINAAGALVFSTCLGQFPTRPGGPQGADFFDGVRDLVLDSSGRIYVTGIGSVQLPFQNPIQTSLRTDADPASAAFVAAIDPTTSSPTLVFSSLLAPSQTGIAAGNGFGGGNYPNAIGVDSAQNIYVSGQSFGNGTSAELPVFSAIQPAPKEPYFSPYSDAFVLKIAPTDAPAAAVSPGALLFNGQAIGVSSPPQTVTIFNMGSASLSISNIAVSGDFATQGNCVVGLAGGGGSCSVEVTFNPTVTGNRIGALTITDNSAGSPHTVALAGAIGLAKATFSPTTVSFPNTTVGVNFEENLTLTNTGSLPLIITNVQVSGPFSAPAFCTYLVGGASCNNNIFFSPTTFGPATGSITLTDNAPGSPHVIQLTGSSAPTLGLGPAPSNFPDISVTAGSSGSTELVVGGAGIGGSVSLSCSGAPAGATCSLSPSTLTANATTPSRTQLIVTTTARSHLLPLSPMSRRWFWPVGALALLLLFRFATPTLYLRPRGCLVPLFALALCACGGGGSSGGDSGGGSGGSGTPAGNYTIVVTAKSGSTTQSLNVNLSVQ
jgi:hypothetical protein